MSSSDGRSFGLSYEKATVTTRKRQNVYLLKSATGRGLAMTFRHDENGNMTAVERNGRGETFAYDLPGNYRVRLLMTGHTDANSRSTGYAYNEADLSFKPRDCSSVVLPHQMV